MISSCMIPLVNHIDKSVMPKLWKGTTAMERPRAFQHVYRQLEGKVFRGLHRGVVDDEGVPTLKKRGFMIPGNREVMTLDERSDLLSKVDK